MKFTTVFAFLIVIVTESAGQGDTLSTLDEILKLKWSVKGIKNTSNPLLHDGLVFETYGVSYALDALTGDKILFNRLDHQKRLRSLTKDSLIYFSSSEGNALINIFSGKRIYESKIRIDAPWIKKPRVVSGRFLFTAVTDSLFAAIDVQTGRIVWNKKMKNIYNYPVIASSIVYVGDSKFLYALESDTGIEKNRYEIGNFESDPILISDIIYVWLKNRGLVALNISTGKIVWEKQQVRIDNNYKIIIENGVLFSNEDHLRALTLKDGKVVWENKAIESMRSFILFSSKRYLFGYKLVDDYSVLSATEKSTGKLMFEAFTTFYDDRPSMRPLANLEGTHFRFADEMHKNLVYAVEPFGNIFCFEIKEE